MRCLRTILFIFIFILCSFIARSQDIFGGEIITTHVSGLTYKWSIFLYTKTSISVNHSSILVSTTGVGGPYNSITGASTVITNDVTKWEYSYNYTYPTNGTYTILVKDSFRIANIMNITNSSIEKILLQKDLIISPFFTNSSPVLQSKPTTISINGGSFIYNPNAIDVDGDSLSYSLVAVSASNYSFPIGAVIDSITGSFTMPVVVGSYAIGIKIDEWKSGVNIGSTIREMIIDSNMITSIKIEEQIETIKIFPNPNSGLFKIELDDINGKVEVNIFNIVEEVNFSKNQNGNTLNIDISNHPKGMYLVKVVSGNKVSLQKIVYQ